MPPTWASDIIIIKFTKPTVDRVELTDGRAVEYGKSYLDYLALTKANLSLGAPPTSILEFDHHLHSYTRLIR